MCVCIIFQFAHRDGSKYADIMDPCFSRYFAFLLKEKIKFKVRVIKQELVPQKVWEPMETVIKSKQTSTDMFFPRKLLPPLSASIHNLFSITGRKFC